MNLFSLFRKQYYPLNTITISQNRLLANFEYLSGFSANLKIAPVLKSNAYGHGLIHVAKILDKKKPVFICVDSLYEAYELLKANIKSPILIMGYVRAENLKVKKLPFSYAVYDKDTASAINKYQPGAEVHIFVDSGMHREGVLVSELPELLLHLKTLRNIKVSGLMSHLGESEEPNKKSTLTQLKNFKLSLQLVNDANFFPKYIHLGNSSAILHFKEYAGFLGNVARSGIALYGIDPENRNKNLKPVLELKSYLSYIKPIKKDEKVGYSFTYKAAKDQVIGILPLGYHDGVDRRFSSNAVVKINGINCPIIGRISMNLTTIDITNIKNPKLGMEVIVYSRTPEDENSIYKLSQQINTIPYDLLVNLTTTTRREIID